MAEISEEQRQQYAGALRDLCRSRSVTPSGRALALYLRTQGQGVDAYTLKTHLEGTRTPRAKTVEKILKGFNASASEREMLLVYSASKRGSDTVSIRDALLPSAGRGKINQQVHWTYQVGHTDEEDFCRENRCTVVGSQPVSNVSFAIGQLGTLGFDLLDTHRLGLRVDAWRVTRSGDIKITARCHIVEFVPSANRYHVVARFSEPVQDETVRWVVGYRWPGLWRSLRENGIGDGSLDLDGEDKVQSASVRILAPLDEFDDLKLIPQGDRRGKLDRLIAGPNVSVRWTVNQPVSPLRFEVRSQSHGQR